jgi:hypothetical protein
MEPIGTIQRMFMQHRTFRAVLAELESHSDRELMNDLRLTRADLPRLAYEEAERRVATCVHRHSPQGRS